MVLWWSIVSGLDPKDPEDAALLSFARERVFEVEGSVPHTWLFPQCAAVVHHGG